jgi:uncharacterized Zn finger protein (UPF0148 family)
MGMSDFDKEAEREKLRERFAEEDERRETTEQMSELLLQGATMTDTHCDTCGSPLFRYDGQTFCPNCQQTAAEGETDDQTATPDSTPTDDEPTPADAGDHRTGTEQSRPRQDRGANQTPRTAQQPQDSGSPSPQHTPPSQTGDTGERRTRRSETTTHPGGTDDLGAAEASLSRMLAELTATAEETADLGRTREHLAAAREAAEALDAVRTARR